MKYAVNTNGLKKKYSISEIVDMSVKLQLDGIEWGLSGLEGGKEEIAEMAARTADAGLEVVGYINGGKMFKSDEMKRWAEIVNSVNGKYLRVAHPWIAYNYDESLHQEKSFNDIFQMARDSMPDVVALSKESGIRFVVETHGGALVASTLAAVKLFDGFDSDCVGVIYDPANTKIEGGLRPRSEIEVMGDYMAYVHVKNTMYCNTGDLKRHPVARAAWTTKTIAPDCGILDWLEVYFALNTTKFQGYLSMEEFFSDGDNQYEQLRDALIFLKECENHAPTEILKPYTTFND
jgi:sugar phosphate isomerase/epimerase